MRQQLNRLMARSDATAIAFLLAACLCAGAENKTTPGTLVVQPPTLHCLGFEWFVSGDDNRNAAVTLAYRKPADKAWREALPLLRVRNEVIQKRNPQEHYVCGNLFAGSVFALDPDTEYEVKLTLSDPDGGGAEKLVTARTRAEPKAVAPGKTLHVYPPAKGTGVTNGIYSSLQAAADAARPGDLVLVHAGTHEGPFVFTRGGLPDKPVVFRGAGDGETIILGTGTECLLDLHAADYIRLENLVFRDPGTGDGGSTVDGVTIFAGNHGQQKPGCKGLTVTRCLFEDFGVAIMAADGVCRDFYIADNVFIGRRPTGRPEWEHRGKGDTWTAVWIAGQGHAICHNRISKVWDGIDITVSGAHPSMGPGRQNASIDIYRNDIFQVADDFVETDSSTSNVRVYENRCMNSEHCGLSAQPVFGGPVYFIRNTVYNTKLGIALKFNCSPAGLLVYHNTLFGGVSDFLWENAHFRNNIFANSLINTGTPRPASTSMDFNAYIPTPGMAFMQFITVTNEPGGPLERMEKTSSPEEAKKMLDQLPLQYISCQTIEEAREKLGFEKHGLVVDMSIFRKAKATPVVTRKTIARQGAKESDYRLYTPDELDLRPQEQSKVVDAGERLPTINDSFNGKGPDIGAYECGAPQPVYGPRPAAGG